MKWNLDHKNKRSKYKNKDKELKWYPIISTDFDTRNIYRIKLYPSKYMTFNSTKTQLLGWIYVYLGAHLVFFFLPPK